MFENNFTKSQILTLHVIKNNIFRLMEESNKIKTRHRKIGTGYYKEQTC